MSKKKKLLLGGGIVAAIIAILFATGGASQAATLITSAMIKDQDIASRDLGPDSVGTSELKPGSTYFANLSKGTQDLINSKANKSFVDTKDNELQDNILALEADSNAKISDLESRMEVEETEGDTVGLNEARAGAGYTTVAKPGYSVAYNKCDEPGQVAISGGYRLNGHASEAFSGADQNAMPEGLTVVATEPAAEKGGTLVNSYQDPDFPQTEDGAFQANAWAVTFKNDTDHDLPVRVWATCVSIN